LGFDYSTFRKRVRFIGSPNSPISLTGISFKGVDLSNFEFHNVEWIEKSEIFKQRMIVIDELFDRRFGNFEEISKIYNQLRKNYESKLLFNEASNFFIGEMEAIRKSMLSLVVVVIAVIVSLAFLNKNIFLNLALSFSIYL
jgi:hypothetical protein